MLLAWLVHAAALVSDLKTGRITLQIIFAYVLWQSQPSRLVKQIIIIGSLICQWQQWWQWEHNKNWSMLFGTLLCCSNMTWIFLWHLVEYVNTQQQIFLSHLNLGAVLRNQPRESKFISLWKQPSLFAPHC